MINSFRLNGLLGFVGCLAFLGCASSTTAATGDAGPTASNPNTLSCLVEINGASPSCSYYEATGPDAASAIASIRTQGCVSAAGEKDTVIAACATADNLGGCKTPVSVIGGNAQVTVTRFQYKSATGFQTSEAVQKNCTAPNASYVPSP